MRFRLCWIRISTSRADSVQEGIEQYDNRVGSQKHHTLSKQKDGSLLVKALCSFLQAC